MSRADSSKTVIFIHIPKTAGTTFRSIVARQYRARELCLVYPDEGIDDVSKIAFEERNQIKAVMGHFGFDLHRLFPQQCSYITFLRDPVERVISDYYFILRTKQHRLHNELVGNGMSLEDFVQRESKEDIFDGQAKAIAGYARFEPSAIYDQSELFQQALSNLKNHFSFVGITERFDQSVILLKHLLNWKWIFYQKEQVAPFRPRREDVSSRVVRLIEERNRADSMLYKLISRELDRVWMARRASLGKELSLFRFANATYGNVFMNLTRKGLQTQNGRAYLLTHMKRFARNSVFNVRGNPSDMEG